MKEYQVCVERKSRVSVVIKANSKEEAIAIYQDGDYDAEEECIDDCTDISDPEVYPVEER